MLQGLGVETDACTDKAKLILIRNGGEHVAVLSAIPGPGEGIETAAGSLTGGETLALDGIPISRMDGDLSITVLRNGEEIDRAAFNYVYDPAMGVIKLLNTIRPE